MRKLHLPTLSLLLCLSVLFFGCADPDCPSLQIRVISNSEIEIETTGYSVGAFEVNLWPFGFSGYLKSADSVAQVVGFEPVPYTDFKVTTRSVYYWYQLTPVPGVKLIRFSVPPRYRRNDNYPPGIRVFSVVVAERNEYKRQWQGYGEVVVHQNGNLEAYYLNDYGDASGNLYLEDPPSCKR
jgi:hypothetical protein